MIRRTAQRQLREDQKGRKKQKRETLEEFMPPSAAGASQVSEDEMNSEEDSESEHERCEDSPKGKVLPKAKATAKATANAKAKAKGKAKAKPKAQAKRRAAKRGKDDAPSPIPTGKPRNDLKRLRGCKHVSVS